MNYRFSNPHPNFNPTQNQQQGGNMSTGPQRVPILVYLPNGMIQLPDGRQVTPEQAQYLINTGALNIPNNMNMNPVMPMNPGMPYMQPGMPMNPGMPYMQPGVSYMQPGMPMNPGMHPLQGNFPTNTNRFSNQNQTISGQITTSPQENNSFSYENRFSLLTKKEGPQMQQVQQDSLKTFSIDIHKGFKFDNNTNILLTAFYDEIKPNQILAIKDKFTVTSCFEEAIEVAIENAYDEDHNKLVVACNYLVENKFYKTFGQEKFNELINKEDIKAIYRAMKSLWSSLTSKYDIHLLSYFDTVLTKSINDFLAINSPEEVFILSFMADFNDALKFVRNLENVQEEFQDYLEDELINYLNDTIKDIKEGLESLKQAKDDENKDNVTYIPEFYNIVYVDKYSYELGVGNAPSSFKMIKHEPINMFLLSLANFVFNTYNTHVCYMVTIDKRIIKLARNLGGKIFIKDHAGKN